MKAQSRTQPVPLYEYLTTAFAGIVSVAAVPPAFVYDIVNDFVPKSSTHMKAAEAAPKVTVTLFPVTNAFVFFVGEIVVEPVISCTAEPAF